MQHSHNMNDFRCSNSHCNQLQYKYKVIGNLLEIEIKCYACNAFSYMTINLNNLKQQYDENKKHVDKTNNISKS